MTLIEGRPGQLYFLLDEGDVLVDDLIGGVFFEQSPGLVEHVDQIEGRLLDFGKAVSNLEGAVMHPRFFDAQAVQVVERTTDDIKRTLVQPPAEGPEVFASDLQRMIVIGDARTQAAISISPHTNVYIHHCSLQFYYTSNFPIDKANFLMYYYFQKGNSR
jgi:hypothetical protein